MDRTEVMQEALAIVRAQAAVRTMTAEEITSMVRHVADGIMGVDAAPDAAEEPAAYGDPKSAIKEKSITCLECGKSFKVLTKKHLATHGLTPEEYRAKYGYKKSTPLIAKALQRARRKKMKDMKLWERRQKPAAEGEKA